MLGLLNLFSLLASMFKFCERSIACKFVEAHLIRQYMVFVCYSHSSRWQLEEIYVILLKMWDLASEQVRAPVPTLNGFGTSTTV
jgi:hypothetical protein